LIELLHDNYFIEDLVIEGNNHVNQSQKDTIQQECRKNLMIKEFILPHLKSQEGNFLADTHRPVEGESHFKNYNVESL
jgi:Leucine-rich repeat (LRR) protein